MLPCLPILRPRHWCSVIACVATLLVSPAAIADSSQWTFTGSLNTARNQHTATLLPNGKVLVAGGFNGVYLATAELYDPGTGTWSPTGSLRTARSYHTATLLPNGKVLVAGGQGTGLVRLATTELYDPSAGTWTFPGNLKTGRFSHTATL